MNTRSLILIFAIALAVLGSCKNNDEVFAPVAPLTSINIVNASVDTLNFYLNGTRLNNTSIIVPEGQSFYLPVPSGQQNYSFKNAGYMLLVNPVVLFNLPLSLKDSTYNSLYVYGGTASQTVISKDTLLIDSIPTNTQIRFANVSPDAGTLDVSIDSATYKARAFKSSSVFLHMGSGLKQVMVYKTGTTTPLIDTSMVFEPGYIYTLFSKGLLKGKGNATFDVGVAINSN